MIDRVLDQGDEKKPKDPTICERVDTHRFADHEERLIHLLARVMTVSVEMAPMLETMKADGPR